MNVITLIEEEILKGWEWVKTEATDIYQALKGLIAAPLQEFQRNFLHVLWGAAAAFVKKALTFTNLADLETAFLNTVELVGAELLSAAQALGSALLQAWLGVLQAKAAKA